MLPGVETKNPKSYLFILIAFSKWVKQDFKFVAAAQSVVSYMLSQFTHFFSRQQ